MIFHKRKRRLIFVVLCIAAILALFQLYWLVVVSVQRTDILSGWPPNIIPRNPTLVNYRYLDWAALARWLVNSIVVASVATLLACAFSAMAGYAMAKLVHARWLLTGLLLAATLPVQIVVIPQFILVANKMGLYDNLWGLILPAMFAPLAIYLVRQFCLRLPPELFDAARIDGASEWQIFRFVVLPLLRPVLAAVAILWFTHSWNDFLWQSVMIKSISKMTAPVGLALFAAQDATTSAVFSAAVVQGGMIPIGLSKAASVIVGLPTCILFIVLQKYLARYSLGVFK